jgi:hypothetical protein
MCNNDSHTVVFRGLENRDEIAIASDDHSRRNLAREGKRQKVNGQLNVYPLLLEDGFARCPVDPTKLESSETNLEVWQRAEPVDEPFGLLEPLTFEAGSDRTLIRQAIVVIRPEKWFKGPCEIRTNLGEIKPGPIEIFLKDFLKISAVQENARTGHKKSLRHYAGSLLCTRHRKQHRGLFSLLQYTSFRQDVNGYHARSFLY